jgi:AcrR family transcriptional regulator
MNKTTQPPKRGYDASRRQAMALETRRRIVSAAHDLFVQDGFAATTVVAIAEAANVSTPTVYANFSSKAALLQRAIEVALAGDDEPVVVANRPTAKWVYEASTAEEMLSRYAVMAGELSLRAGPIFSVLASAADSEPELAALLKTFEAQRLRASTAIAQGVHARGGLPAGRTLEAARDTIWLCIAPEVYTLLTARRGWSTKRYVEWVRNALLQLVVIPVHP